MSSFDKSIKIILQNEGGYQSLEKDKGNYNSLGQLVGTNRGISAPIFEAYLKRVPTVADVKGITEETAKNIYLKLFWNPSNIGNIEDQFISNHIFDMYINMNPRDAVDVLQDSINIVTPGAVENDKVLGHKTVLAINNIIKSGQSAKLNSEIYNQRVKKYESFGGPFLNSWINRASIFKNYILDVTSKKKI